MGYIGLFLLGLGLVTFLILNRDKIKLIILSSFIVTLYFTYFLWSPTIYNSLGYSVPINFINMGNTTFLFSQAISKEVITLVVRDKKGLRLVDIPNTEENRKEVKNLEEKSKKGKALLRKSLRGKSSTGGDSIYSNNKTSIEQTPDNEIEKETK